MTTHGSEEMAEDDLTIIDVEHCVLKGAIARVERDDPRGNRDVIEGLAADSEIQVCVVGRFVESGRYLIITVYKIS